MDDRAYLSIGEVLALLREDFPDVTISKIRFLESQGLLDPERTPSGYRKFYDDDVSRLRWILRQQRENFLPLKVIKGRLEDATTADGRPAVPPEEPGEGSGPPAAPGVREAGEGPIDRGPAAVTPLDPADGPFGREQVSLDLEELADAAGLSPHDVAELERFGLVVARRVGPSTFYDHEALGVARLAAAFMRFGVEARHLRTYKVAGEREAGLFEQVVMPMLRQRDPEARRAAREALGELAQLGQGLRAAMVREALRQYLEGP